MASVLPMPAGLETVTETLADPVFWKRAGTLVLGILLIIVGIVLLIAGDKATVSTATALVSKVL